MDYNRAARINISEATMTDAFGLARLRVPWYPQYRPHPRHHSAGRKVGLRTTTKGEQPHLVVTNPIPLVTSRRSCSVLFLNSDRSPTPPT